MDQPFSDTDGPLGTTEEVPSWQDGDDPCRGTAVRCQKKTQRGSRGAPQFHRPQLFRISGYFWSDLASCQKKYGVNFQQR